MNALFLVHMNNSTTIVINYFNPCENMLMNLNIAFVGIKKALSLLLRAEK